MAWFDGFTHRARNACRACALSGFVALLGWLAVPARAAELKPETVAAFDNYIGAAEARMAEELSNGDAFLWMDRVPQPRRETLYAQLRRGEIAIAPLNVEEEGKPIKVPGGLIHDWVGVIFIPGATLQQSLAVVQDYGSHQNIYKPHVQRSKVLRREGNHFKVYLRLYRKTIVTAVFDTEYDVRYFPDDATRVHSRSYSTRIAELENPGGPDERQMTVGNDRGYLWRLYSYWRFQEKDGGVYVQLETIALSRGVPSVFLWLVGPLLKKIPRETISLLLHSTRMAVNNKGGSSKGTAQVELLQ